MYINTMHINMLLVVIEVCKTTLPVQEIYENLVIITIIVSIFVPSFLESANNYV